MLSYRSTSSSKAGGSASGGGGGSSRSRRSSSRRAFNQPIVDVGTPRAQASQPNHDGGMNVAHFDGGSVGNGNGRGPSSGGNGGSGGNGDHEPTKPGPPDNGHLCPVDPPISGTPEPAAFVVWALAGCCGYGFLRFSQKRPLK